MNETFAPAASVIGEHLAAVEVSVGRPRWQRAETSLELLLGLRDPEVDDRLRRILDGGGAVGWWMDAEALTGALVDDSVHRVVDLSLRSGLALSLAWLQTTAAEVDELITALEPELERNLEPARSPWIVFASLCQIAGRWSGPRALDRLALLGPVHWRDRLALAVAAGSRATPPELAPVAVPGWSPEVPPARHPSALTRDPLTGLHTRNSLFVDPHRFRLPGWNTFADLPTEGVVMVDVDHMKRINDVNDMSTGDRVLRALADRVVSLVGDRVVRFGGDELLILWEGEDIADVAEAVVDAARALRVPAGLPSRPPVSLTVSAGVARGDGAVAALEAADEALTRAKIGGRDRVETA